MEEHSIHLPPDSAFNESNVNRLGKCEVCGEDAKYSCPKCEVKTCCLKCVRIHKEELKCNGIRDRTKFIPLKYLTEKDFMNDYYFLEECTRFAKDLQRNSNQIKAHNIKRHAISKVFQLREAAQDRRTMLKILPQIFLKRKNNTSYYNRKSDTIFWRIEWIFSNAGGLKFLDKYCSENDKLSTLLDKYLNPDSQQIPKLIKKRLEFYQSKGLANLRILLKSEGIKSCAFKFYELNSSNNLKENLYGKTIIEFPHIHVCYDIENVNYDIIKEAEMNNILNESKILYDGIRKSLNEQKKWVEKQSRIDYKCKTDEEVADELKKIKEDKLKWNEFEESNVTQSGFNFLISNDNDFIYSSEEN